MTWLDAHPSLWPDAARAVALDVGVALLANEGEAGVNRTIFGLLLAHPSQAVRAIAAKNYHARLWRVEPTAYALERYFQLPASGHKALYAQLRVRVLRPRAGDAAGLAAS